MFVDSGQSADGKDVGSGQCMATVSMLPLSIVSGDTVVMP